VDRETHLLRTLPHFGRVFIAKVRQHRGHVQGRIATVEAIGIRKQETLQRLVRWQISEKVELRAIDALNRLDKCLCAALAT
jgi:hypothetical protein